MAATIRQVGTKTPLTLLAHGRRNSLVSRRLLDYQLHSTTTFPLPWLICNEQVIGKICSLISGHFGHLNIPYGTWKLTQVHTATPTYCRFLLQSRTSNHKCLSRLASFPDPSLNFLSLVVQKSGRGPGTLHHMSHQKIAPKSDWKGNVSCVFNQLHTHTHTQHCVSYGMYQTKVLFFPPVHKRLGTRLVLLLPHAFHPTYESTFSTCTKPHQVTLAKLEFTKVISC